MNPYRAYQEQAYQSWLRIDMVLALYDGVIGKLEAALAALRKPDARGAKAPLDRARLILAGLVSAVDPARGEMAAHFLRLYEYVNHAIGAADARSVESALKVLRTLREGLEAIRPEATELERSGRIPAVDAQPQVQLTV